MKIKSEADRKKDRQRNLIPARSGISVMMMTIITTLIYYTAYGWGMSVKLDAYTRSWFLAFSEVFYPCFFGPLIVVFEAPVIRRKINKTFHLCKSHVQAVLCIAVLNRVTPYQHNSTTSPRTTQLA